MPKFNSNKSSKRILSGLLITAMVTLNFSFLLVPQKAQAAVVNVNVLNVLANTFQTMWDTAKGLWAKALKIAARTLVLTLAQSIATWISNGFQGNPSFLNDPTRFAKSVADVAIGEMIYEDPSLNFLCKPFQLQLKLSLALQHRKFYQTVNCTLSGVVDNVTNAYNNFANGDFINGGGWDTFLTIVTDPSATPEGAFLVMDSELTLRMQNKQGTLDKELAQGQGSLSFRSCTETTYGVDKDSNGALTKTETGQRTFTGNPFYDQSTTTSSNTNTDGYSGTSIETTCKITSPGTLIASKLWYGQTAGQRITEFQAVMGDAFDIIFSALSQYVIEQFMGAVLNQSGTQNYYDNDQTIQDLQTQQSANSNNSNNSNNPNNPSNPLTSAKTTAGNIINNQKNNIETPYKNIQNSTLSYGNAIGMYFVNIMACNNSNNLNGDRNPAIDAISGVLNQLATATSSIPSNVTAATTNITELDSRYIAVQNATTQAEINSQLVNLNPPVSPFHTDGVSTTTATSINNLANSLLNWSAISNIPSCSCTISTATMPKYSDYQ